MVFPDALRAVLPQLRCPVCGAEVMALDAGVHCTSGHAFDVARQGYLAMLTGRGAPTADTAAMVIARDEVLSAGLLDPVTTAVVDATGSPDGLVLDLAGGTGHYLAAVLDASPPALGLCLDASAPALRRAARAHPRAAAVSADAWGLLPLASGVVDVALSVFGPRNAVELTRVLGPGGRVVVAAPTGDHLAELVGPLGLVRVDDRKAERQAATFADFTAAGTTDVRYEVSLDHADVAAWVSMGPSANHLTAPELVERMTALPALVRTTVAVRVTTYVR